MNIKRMDIRNLNDKDLLLTENEQGMPILVYKTKGKDNKDKINSIPLLKKNGIEFTPQTLKMIKFASKNNYGNIYCELSDDRLITSLNHYTNVPLSRIEEEQQDPISMSNLDLSSMTPDQLAQLAAYMKQNENSKQQHPNHVEQPKTRQKSKVDLKSLDKIKDMPPTGFLKIQNTDNIWVTDQEGKPEILYGGDRNEILSMPLQNENGEYNEEAFQMIKKVAADKKRHIYFDLASEKLGKEIEKQAGFKIPLNKKKKDDTAMNKTASRGQKLESSKTINTLSLIDTASNGKKQQPTVVTEYSDGTLEYTPILKEDNTLDRRAVSDIDEYLSQKGIDFVEALNTSKINVQLPDSLLGMLYTAINNSKEINQSNIKQEPLLLEDKQAKLQNSNNQELFLLEDKQLQNKASAETQNSNNQELFLIEDKQAQNKVFEDYQNQSENASKSGVENSTNYSSENNSLNLENVIETICFTHDTNEMPYFHFIYNSGAISRNLPLINPVTQQYYVETFSIIDTFLKSKGANTIQEALENEIITTRFQDKINLIPTISSSLEQYQKSLVGPIRYLSIGHETMEKKEIGVSFYTSNATYYRPLLYGEQSDIAMPYDYDTMEHVLLFLEQNNMNLEQAINENRFRKAYWLEETEFDAVKELVKKAYEERKIYLQEKVKPNQNINDTITSFQPFTIYNASFIDKKAPAVIIGTYGNDVGYYLLSEDKSENVELLKKIDNFLKSNNTDFTRAIEKALITATDNDATRQIQAAFEEYQEEFNTENSIDNPNQSNVEISEPSNSLDINRTFNSDDVTAICFAQDTNEIPHFCFVYRDKAKSRYITMKENNKYTKESLAVIDTFLTSREIENIEKAVKEEVVFQEFGTKWDLLTDIAEELETYRENPLGQLGLISIERDWFEKEPPLCSFVYGQHAENSITRKQNLTTYEYIIFFLEQNNMTLEEALNYHRIVNFDNCEKEQFKDFVKKIEEVQTARENYIREGMKKDGKQTPLGLEHKMMKVICCEEADTTFEVQFIDENSNSIAYEFDSNTPNIELLEKIDDFLEENNIEFDQAVKNQLIEAFSKEQIDSIKKAFDQYKDSPNIASPTSNSPEVHLEFFETQNQNNELEPVFRLRYKDSYSPLFSLNGSDKEETYYIINYYLKQNGVATIKEAIKEGLIIQDIFTTNELLDFAEQGLSYYQKAPIQLTKIEIHHTTFDGREEIECRNIYAREDIEVTSVHRLTEENQYNEQALYYIKHLLTSNNMDFEEALEKGLIENKLFVRQDELMEEIKTAVEQYQEGKTLQKTRTRQSSQNSGDSSSNQEPSANATTENISSPNNIDTMYSNITSVTMKGTFESKEQPSRIDFKCSYPDETTMKFSLFSDGISNNIVNIATLNEVLKSHQYETFIDAYNGGLIEVAKDADLSIDAIFYLNEKIEEYKNTINHRSTSPENTTFASKVLSIELSYMDTDEEKGIPTCRFNYEDYHSAYIKLRGDGAREFHHLLQENNLSLDMALKDGFVYKNSEVEDTTLEVILSKIEEELMYCQNFPISPINDMKIELDNQNGKALNLVISYGDESTRPGYDDYYHHPLSDSKHYILDTFDCIDRFLMHKNMSFDTAMNEGIITFDDRIDIEEIKNIQAAVETYKNIDSLAYTPEEKEFIRKRLQERNSIPKEAMKIFSFQHEYGFSGAKIMPPSKEYNPYNIDENGILLFDFVAQYRQEAFDCIDRVLKDQDMTFEEALEQGIIKVDSNPKLSPIIENLKLEYSEEVKVLSMKIEQFTGENNPKLFINYSDGSTGQFNLLTEDGKDNQETLEYIENVLQENNLSYEDARRSKFIDFIPRKALSKVVTYSFKEPMHTENAPLQALNLSSANDRKMRTVTQACVFYKDGSFKNVLLEQREPQTDGKEIVYCFNDNLMNEIEDATGVRMTLDDIKNSEKVEERTGKEFEDNFSKYLEEAKNKEQPHQERKTGVMQTIKLGANYLKNWMFGRKYKLIKDHINKYSNVTMDPSKFKCSRQSKVGAIKEGLSSVIAKGTKLASKIYHKNPRLVRNVVISAGLIGTAAIVTLVSYNPIPKKTDNVSNSKETKTENIYDNNIALFSDMSVEEAFNALPLGPIRAMQLKQWNYINYYNKTLANQCIEEGKASKLAITYDNVKAEYFGYNADLLKQNDINMLYGNYKTSVEELKDNLRSGHEEDMMAYVVSKEEVDKTNLFKTEDGQYFHHKYAKIVAEMASASTPHEKAVAVDKFRQFVTQEIDVIQQEFSENGKVPSYKLSLVPILDAAEFICERDQLGPILTEAQRNDFKNIVTSQTDAYFAELTEKLSAVQAAETENEYSIYGIFKEKVENELTKQGLYDINNRDIRDHNEFVVEKEEEKSSENIEVVINDRSIEYEDAQATETVYYTAETYAQAANNTSEVTKTVFTANTDTIDKKEDLKIDEIEDTTSETTTQEKTDAETKTTAEKKAETIQKNYQQEEDTKQKNLEKVTKMNNDTYQKNLEQTKTVDTINNNTLGNGTEILEEYKDKNGNLDNFVQDLTTNGTDANKPLPVLNTEKQDKNEGVVQTEDNGINVNNTEYVKKGEYHIVESETSIDAEKLAEEAVNKMANEPIVTGTREAKSK